MVVPRSGTLTARGRLIHAGKTVAVSLFEVTDDAGRLLAVTTTRCTILLRIPASSDMVEQARAYPPHPTEPAWPSPHPYQRPINGTVLPQQIWEERSGLDILRLLIAGELPAPRAHRDREDRRDREPRHRGTRGNGDGGLRSATARTRSSWTLGASARGSTS